jgi:PAS domain S-box-containing protein
VKTGSGAGKTKRLPRDEIFDAIPVVVAVIQDDRILDVNESVTSLLGYTPEELLNQPFLDLVHPDSSSDVREIHTRRLARKLVPEQYEADLKTRDGASRPFEVRVQKILHRGKRAFVVSLMPMDNRREREENRLQSKKTEALLTMAEALASRFETTCASVRKHVERLKDVAGSSRDDLVREVRTLTSMTDEALKTTAQLKTIATMDRPSSAGSVFDLRTVVKEAIAQGRAEWEKSKGEDLSRVQVKTYLRSGSRIHGDPEELEGVFAHLIRNALESMPSGGDLYVTSEEIGGAAHVYIMDNGTGVPEQVRDRIFDPFFTTRGENKEGLGLSVAYAVICRHGGRIEVTSEKRQGTEIHIQLPVAPPKGEAGPKPVKAPPGPFRILVVAPTPALETLLVRVLTSRGWEVVSTSNPAEGFYRLRRERFGLVILESSQKTGKNRTELCRRIKALGHGVLITLVTEDGGDTPDVLPHEVDLVLKKPLFMEAFQDHIQRLFRGGGPGTIPRSEGK